jgi:hypothetical protein
MMKSLYKAALMTGLTSLSIGTPAIAQIANGVDFTTTFPFYAGNAKMPAGAYTITQPPDEDGSHSAFLDIAPTQAANPHPTQT